MKSAVFCILFLAAFATHAQDYDSLKQKILKMDVAINNIHYNMARHQKQFRTGTMVMATGVALTVAGILLMDRKAEDVDNENPEPTMVYIGGAVMTIGTIIQIDAHKWLGRGGKRRLS